VSDDKNITVSRTIDASTKDVFDVLTNPERHAELDGSGFVVSDEKSDRITSTAQVFGMNMTGDYLGGDSQTDNTVTGYDPHHLVARRPRPRTPSRPAGSGSGSCTPRGRTPPR
jgi:uncharacterized protein YndB with AHSA1/START domain